MKDPRTKAAAIAIKALRPQKAWTWSYFTPSNATDATIKRRTETIPRYLTAVLNDAEVRSKMWW